jgi:hypothetical protein
MRKLLALALMLTLVGSAMAFDLGNQSATKPAYNAPPNVVDPLLQGGDTILDATAIAVGGTDSGTTAGYVNDYDEVCPYTGSLSPDVVYTFIAPGDMQVDVDLFGSTYDTKVYVYDENLALVACNDDFYSDYVSKIEEMPIMNGVQYFVVVDGYSGAFGNYVLTIVEFIPDPPCIIECPPTGVLEGEPPLTYNYDDQWNGGCNTPGTEPFQLITSDVFCGVSGFYVTDAGNSRDTDWFIINVPASGMLEITGDAEVETYMFELGPQDCASTGVIQNVIMGPCAAADIFIAGAPGSPVWFWVGPTDFYAPDGSDLYEYDYVLLLNLGGIASQDHTWTVVKSLFE